MAFIRLTDRDGLPIYVNPNHIAYIEQSLDASNEGGAYISLAHSVTDDDPASLHVKQSPDEILRLIREAES